MEHPEICNEIIEWFQSNFLSISIDFVKKSMNLNYTVPLVSKLLHLNTACFGEVRKVNVFLIIYLLQIVLKLDTVRKNIY